MTCFQGTLLGGMGGARARGIQGSRGDPTGGDNQRKREAGSPPGNRIRSWTRRLATIVLAGSLTLVPVSIVFVTGAEDALDQDVRREIYEQVHESPGLHLSEIARETDLSTNHAKYHLRVLEDNDFVTSLRSDGYWRFFPKENGAPVARELVDREAKQILSLLRQPVPVKITAFLLEEGQGYNQEFAEFADVSPSTSHYHLKKMEETGMVESSREGRSVIYELTSPERVRTLVSEYDMPDALVEGFLEGWDLMEL